MTVAVPVFSPQDLVTKLNVMRRYNDQLVARGGHPSEAFGAAKLVRA